MTPYQRVLMTIIGLVGVIALLFFAQHIGYQSGRDDPSKYGTFVVHCHDKHGRLLDDGDYKTDCIVNNTIVDIYHW